MLHGRLSRCRFCRSTARHELPWSERLIGQPGMKGRAARCLAYNTQHKCWYLLLRSRADPSAAGPSIPSRKHGQTNYHAASVRNRASALACCMFSPDGSVAGAIHYELAVLRRRAGEPQLEVRHYDGALPCRAAG